MESSIAVFLTWQSACELLPTEHHGAPQLIVGIQNIDGGQTNGTDFINQVAPLQFRNVFHTFSAFWL